MFCLGQVILIFAINTLINVVALASLGAGASVLPKVVPASKGFALSFRCRTMTG
jgi:hypothetical protein